jgi:hypothetical protein
MLKLENTVKTPAAPSSPAGKALTEVCLPRRRLVAQIASEIASLGPAGLRATSRQQPAASSQQPAASSQYTKA